MNDSDTNNGIMPQTAKFAKSSVSTHKPKKSMIPLRTTNICHSVGYCEQPLFEKQDKPSESRSVKRVVSRHLTNSKNSLELESLQNVLPYLVHRGVSSSSSISSYLSLRRTSDDFSQKKRNLRSVHSSTLHLAVNDSLDKNPSQGDISTVHLQDNFSAANVDSDTGHIQDDKLLIQTSNHSNLSSVTSTKINNLCAIKQFAVSVGKTAGRTGSYFLCPICSEPFNKPAIIACGHLFCMACVSGWFETQDNCPCCRYRIISKEIGTSLILAKEYFDASRLLASIFTAANFNTLLLDNPPLSNDLENTSPQERRSLLSCNISKQILENHLAPIFQHLFPGNGVTISQQKSISERDLYTRKMTNCTRAAIWFVRRCLLLRRPCEDSFNFEDSKLIQKLPTLIKLEAFRGSESTREALLKRVMINMKQSRMPSSSSSSSTGEPNPYFHIPRPSITQSKRKLSSQHSLRFRFPSTPALIRLSISTTLFLMISLILYLIEGMNKPACCKVDFLVYAIFMTSMLIHTEERVSYRRNRRNNQRENRNTNRNRNETARGSRRRRRQRTGSSNNNNYWRT